METQPSGLKDPSNQLQLREHELAQSYGLTISELRDQFSLLAEEIARQASEGNSGVKLIMLSDTLKEYSIFKNARSVRKSNNPDDNREREYAARKNTWDSSLIYLIEHVFLQKQSPFEPVSAMLIRRPDTVLINTMEPRGIGSLFNVAHERRIVYDLPDKTASWVNETLKERYIRFIAEVMLPIDMSGDQQEDTVTSILDAIFQLNANDADLEEVKRLIGIYWGPNMVDFAVESVSHFVVSNPEQSDDDRSDKDRVDDFARAFVVGVNQRYNIHSGKFEYVADTIA